METSKDKGSNKLIVKLAEIVSDQTNEISSDVSSFNKFNTFEQFYETNEDYLKTAYKNCIELSKEHFTNPAEYIEVDFLVFCHMCWQKSLNIQKGTTFSLYSLINGKLDFHFKIAEFVSTYASKFINVSSEDHLAIQKLLSIKELYKTSYLLYCSMLGVESSYFERLYKTFLDSEVYKNLNDETQKKLSELLLNLSQSNLRHSFYYPEYASIKLDDNFTTKERNFAFDLGIKTLGTWLFAFVILAYRNHNNIHFINLFTEINKPFNINSLDYLHDCFDLFNNAYKQWRKDKKQKKGR